MSSFEPIKAFHRPKDRLTVFSLIFSINHLQNHHHFTKFAD